MLPSSVRWGFTVFFAVHIVITICLDLQGLSFGDSFPESLKALMQFHVDTNHDYLMVRPVPKWFEALLWLELLFQVPFFAFATAGFIRKWNAVRIPCIIYGSSSFTSVVPIIAEVLASEELTDPQRYKLVGIYMPWMILPLVLILVMAADPAPFGAVGAQPILSKKRI